MLRAASDGDMNRVTELVGQCPALATCQYNYTPPIHFAVREGHCELVRFLVENEALDPKYKTYPFGDSLVTMARDRDYIDIAEFLEASLKNASLCHTKGECGEIDYGWDETQRGFEKSVHEHKIREVRRMLQDRPSLATEPNASWGEGILMMPSGRGKKKLLELLMSHGARVPDTSKWGRFYYFKHFEIAEFLLENGMSPKHMSWHQVTLLHDMA